MSKAHPLGKHRRVVIDPERNFGRPIDDATGKPTWVLCAMVEGGSTVEDVADWHDVPVQAVLDAIEYEDLPKEERAAFEGPVAKACEELWDRLFAAGWPDC